MKGYSQISVVDEKKIKHRYTIKATIRFMLCAKFKILVNNTIQRETISDSNLPNEKAHITTYFESSEDLKARILYLG